MGVIKPIAAETALIDTLEGATGWLGQLREATRIQGLPTRRHEMWKWSDLRRAAGEITTAGSITLTGAASGALEPADGETVELGIHASAGASAAVLGLTVKSGRSVTLVERYSSAAGSLGNFHLDIAIESGGRLERICVHDEAEEGVLIASSSIDLATDAKLTQIALAFGGKLMRNETHVMHAGEHSEASLHGVYLLDEGRHFDYTTSVHHTGPGGTTRQLVKGAVAAHARGVFQGKFKVDRLAQHTDAKMTHRALMLDDRAEIDAKPELEIYADDVQCAHGNAIGALDETALFYMRQRGIPLVQARALLIESYLAEPLDFVSGEALRDELRARLQQRLRAIS
ncbi:SufD family Fe-S cluster assembly protein [uncultured Maricaulis sp.]|uniref:SufB/SufD family protein n=1 Tax=uncultured Maricaulis sp. TaxID=174710 RepID=UPI0030D8A8B0|tara:strand:+ start:6867 stop:7895 length:1029 start_codon:yes stop_codon:yes gene_type:complete